MLFNLANLPYWIFLALGIVLFLLVIAGRRGDEELDIDADADFILLQTLEWLIMAQAPFGLRSRVFIG